MNITRFVSKLDGFIKNNQASTLMFQKLLQIEADRQLKSIYEELGEKIKESPINKGYSVYSQNDEDGILEDIFEKINVTKPIFFEFGVAPDENNTNYLLLKGGKGCWIDKGLSEFKKRLPDNKKLLIIDEFVNLENIVSIIKRGCEFLNTSSANVDLISLDLDGNDYYFIEKILNDGIMPKVFCLEYNAIFKPPVNVKIKYSANHQWTGDDYFGCSLMAYYNLLSPFYILVSCNIPGSNCFFVHKSFSSLFQNYPVANLYQPPRYCFSPFSKGHAPSVKFVLDGLHDSVTNN